MEKKDCELAGDCLEGIIAIAERMSGEYTGIIKFLALTVSNLIYKDCKDEN
ncbi:MAG: hypothetical protein J6Q59_07200 [Paludibacteraceae bacterium]|nr:hypothetical protein [Paludibacteraceae bacterium]